MQLLPNENLVYDIGKVKLTDSRLILPTVGSDYEVLFLDKIEFVGLSYVEQPGYLNFAGICLLACAVLSFVGDLQHLLSVIWIAGIIVMGLMVLLYYASRHHSIVVRTGNSSIKIAVSSIDKTQLSEFMEDLQTSILKSR